MKLLYVYVRRDFQSRFYYCGGHVKVLHACLSARMDQRSILTTVEVL